MVLTSKDSVFDVFNFDFIFNIMKIIFFVKIWKYRILKLLKSMALKKSKCKKIHTKFENKLSNILGLFFEKVGCKWRKCVTKIMKKVVITIP